MQYRDLAMALEKLLKNVKQRVIYYKVQQNIIVTFHGVLILYCK